MLRSLKSISGENFRSCVCMVSGGKETKASKKKKKVSTLYLKKPYCSLWRAYLKTPEGIEDTTGILQIMVSFFRNCHF